MERPDIQTVLRSTAARVLSDPNYEQSFAFYRLWFDIGQTRDQIPPDLIFDAIWENRLTSSIDPHCGELIHSTAHLILRFASDAESDQILAPYNSGLQDRLCTRLLREFFNNNLAIVWYGGNSYRGEVVDNFCVDANLVAHWVNLGFVDEAVIRDHILQSLISHRTLYNHQADALIILFKLAGATFGAYTDPSVVDRCLELLRTHYTRDPVCVRLVQEVVVLKENGWEGLPPPPVFTAGRSESAGTDQRNPPAIPVMTSLGLPNGDIEPQTPQPPPPGPAVALETVTVPVPSIAQSPSTIISTLSDFTITDTSDDEPLIIHPTALSVHETFYLQDGNVEVLCWNILFRVHTSILSFHSPALRRMFSQSALAAAESPNGYPRVLSSDTAADFSTLLKVIYLPGFPERNVVPDFTTFSSLLRVTTKYELPALRSQLVEVIRDAYPEAFEGLIPSKVLGERVFSGPTPHPNAVLNLFVEQKLTSALPMAYYMAVRRGPDSLADARHPRSARLPPEVLQVAIKGLIVLRDMELKETHRLIFGSEGSRSCSRPNCPSRNPTGPGVSEARREVVDRIVDSVHSGTKLLQVLSLREVCGGDCLGFCEGCVGRWESGHADVRKKAWAALPDVFGLNT